MRCMASGVNGSQAVTPVLNGLDAQRSRRTYMTAASGAKRVVCTRRAIHSLWVAGRHGPKLPHGCEGLVLSLTAGFERTGFHSTCRGSTG